MTGSFAEAVPGPDGRPLDRISITGISGRGRHGVLESERATGQEFRADVVLHLDVRPAAEGDDLHATVSYADVAQEVHGILVGEPVELIETLAERIAAVALGHGLVQAVDVTVHKPQAPIPVAFADVEVSIRRDRVVTPPVVGGVRAEAQEQPQDRPESAWTPPETAGGESSVAAAAAATLDTLDVDSFGGSAPTTAPGAEQESGFADGTPEAGRPGSAAPVPVQNLVVPQIDPVATTAEQAAEPAVQQPAEQYAPDQQAFDQQSFEQPFEQQAVPAFEPHADAPARPADDNATAVRPAYDPAGHPAAAFVAGAGAAAAELAAAQANGSAGQATAPGAEASAEQQFRQEPEEQFQDQHYQDQQFQDQRSQEQPYPGSSYQDQQFAEQQYPEQQYPGQQSQEQQFPQFAEQQFAEQQFAEQQYLGQGQDPQQYAAPRNQPQEYAPEQAAFQPEVPVHDAAPGDRLDETPAEPVEVVLALGANLGDPQATLRAAVMDLDRIAGLHITDVSPLARTAAVGGPEQPDYLNAVVVVRTTLSPRGLLHACQAIEHAHGRTRDEHWGPRTLDIDVITYGLLTAAADDLEVPHPRAHERAFVLEPWSQLKPDAVLPGLGGGPVAQLAATAVDRQGIRWLALDWLTESNSGADPTGDVEPQPTASHRPYNPPAEPQGAVPGQPGGQHPDHQQSDIQQPGPQQQDPFQPPIQGYPQQDADAGSGQQAYGSGSVQFPQMQASGAVPPPEESLVPAPRGPAVEPGGQAPQAAPVPIDSAPVVPQAVRETAHQEIPVEPFRAEPAAAKPVFSPVRPHAGDVPFAPVNPLADESPQNGTTDERPAWAPIRGDEHGQRG